MRTSTHENVICRESELTQRLLPVAPALIEMGQPEDSETAEAATQQDTPRDIEQAVLAKPSTTVWQQIHMTREDATAAGINPDALERLWLIEHSFYGKYRFANLAIMPEKFLRYLFTREVDMAILHRQLSYKPSPRLLSAGRGIPLRAERAIRRVYAMNALVYGFEFSLISGIKFSLLSLLLYQIVHAGSVTDFLNDLLHGKQRSIYAILTKFDSSHGRYLGLPFALPFILAIARALYASTQAKPLTDQYWQAADVFFTKFREHISEPLTIVKFWHRSLCWMIPLVPGKRRLTMFTDALCWDGRLTNDQRRQAFEWINGVAQGNDYAQFIAMQRLARLAHGVSLTQSTLINKHYDAEKKQLLWKIKTDALIALDKKALTPREAWKQRKLFSVFYAHYLKWTLADSATKSISMFMLVFKLSKTTTSLWIINTFLQALINYLHCPEEYQSGFTLAGGLAEWASQNTKVCFEEYVRLFNTIPGQPADTLTSLIPSFDLRSMTNLDLSNKALNGSTIIAILASLKLQQVPLMQLNLSGNAINQPSDVEALLLEFTSITALDFSHNKLVISNPDSNFNNPSGSVEGLMAFSRRLSQLTRLQMLRLAQNNIGYLDFDATSVNSTIYFGQALGTLTNLRVLCLLGNEISNRDAQNSNGTQAIGRGIAQLKQIQSLDLSRNQISSGDEVNSKGTQALALGIGQLSQLQFLDLSGNEIGSGDHLDSRGTQALALGIGQLFQLKSLDLSENAIGGGDDYNSNGTQTIGIEIGNLFQLQSLDLSGNFIGFKDGFSSEGTQALGIMIGRLSQLRSLYLSENQIGFGDNINSQGTQAIALGLRTLSSLQLLGLGNNDLGRFANNTATLMVARALPFLRQLVGISIMPVLREVIVPVNDPIGNAIVLIDAVRELSASVYSDLPILLFPNEVGYYFHMHCKATTLDLAGQLQGVPPATWVAIGNALADCTRLTALDLSGNYFAEFDNLNSSGTQALGFAIGRLSQLQFLNLSGNEIGSGDQLDSRGTQALAFGIGQLFQLKSLDLSENAIGGGDDYNSNGTRAMGTEIGYLSQLLYLDLSGNPIGIKDNSSSEGTNALIYAISCLSQLTSLGFSGSYLDYWSSENSQKLGKSLVFLDQLRLLSLAGPPPHYLSGFIGSTDNRGVIAVANGIRNLTNLCEINLDNNQIGSAGSDGPLALLEVIPTLPNLKVIGLAGMQNVTWTQAAQALEKINEAQLQSVCYAQKCFGDSGQLPPPTCAAPEASPSVVVSSSFFARQLSQVAENPMIPGAPWQCTSLEKQLRCVSSEGVTRTITPLVGYTLSDVTTDNALHCDTHTEQGMRVTHCVGEKSEYVELHPQSNSSLLSTLGSAILMGAVYTAILEAIGDALTISGLISHENAERVKTVANVALTVTMGSLWATAASYATQVGLRTMGVSAERSRVAANSAAFVVNTVRDFTPLGIAATGANYIAGRFTLWAEKKAARSIAARLQSTVAGASFTH